jgi:UDP-N-acetylglucosamine--N-acetylmuramyl-(pentapeptide) pyrophosphoryl-undecaprenol N-acetylglucosamine transferase
MTSNASTGKRKLKIVMAGGGTGGHIFPAIAIANALKRKVPEVEILFVGAKGKMEMEKVPEAGYPIEGLDIAGFNRSSLMRNIGLPFKLMKSFLQVRSIVKRFRPDAVVGVGGYSSFPVLRYAQAEGIPTFIHESNSFAGKSNILLGKKARKIYVAIDGMEAFFPAEKIMISGNPVRQSIASCTISREEGIRFFGLDSGKKTLVVIGGSLGAKSINEAIAQSLDKLERNGIQLVWQTGKPFAEEGRASAKGRKGVWANDFIRQVEYAFAAADLVISRSGAMSVGELSLMKKPVIFVPYPFAAEDHQTVNARRLCDVDAALMVKDGDAKEKLVDTAVGLLEDDERRQRLSRNISSFGIGDADETVADDILNSIGYRHI